MRLAAAIATLLLPTLALADDERGRGHMSVPDSALQCVGISTDHKFITFGFANGSLSMIELEDGKQKEFRLQFTPAHARPVTAIVYSPGTEYVLTAGLDGTVKVWPAIATARAAEKAESALLAKPSRTVSMQSAGVTCLAVSPDGKTFAAGGADGTVRLATLVTGKAAGKFTAHKGAVTSIAFDPDGKRLATAGIDKTAKVWTGEGDAWKAGVTLDKHAGPVLGVAWSPDGKRLATCGGADKKPGELKVWDAEAGKELLNVPGNPETVTSVIFHPKESRLISCGKDKFVRVRDAETGEELYTDSKHKEPARQVTISADGVWLLSTSADAMAFWLGTPTLPKK